MSPLPEEFHTLTPYLCVRGAAEAIEFYRAAFGAETPGTHVRTPDGTPISFYLYVEDVDAVFQRAVAAGARVLDEPADQGWRDRVAGVVDPFGQRWQIATLEDYLAQRRA